MAFFPDYTKVTVLTIAQLRTLHTIPVQVAPGSPGCIVDIKSVIVEWAGTSAMSTGASDVLCLISGILPNVFVNYPGGIVSAASFVGQTPPLSMFAFPWWDANDQGAADTVGGVPLSDVIGQGINLYQFDNSGPTILSGANWTGGAGTLTVKVQYSYIVA